MQKPNFADLSHNFDKLDEQDQDFYSLVNQYNSDDFAKVRKDVVLHLTTQQFLTLMSAIDRTQINDEQRAVIDYVEHVQFWQS